MLHITPCQFGPDVSFDQGLTDLPNLECESKDTDCQRRGCGGTTMGVSALVLANIGRVLIRQLG
jgi:hypothetical protein